MIYINAVSRYKGEYAKVKMQLSVQTQLPAAGASDLSISNTGLPGDI